MDALLTMDENVLEAEVEMEDRDDDRVLLMLLHTDDMWDLIVSLSPFRAVFSAENTLEAVVFALLMLLEIEDLILLQALDTVLLTLEATDDAVDLMEFQADDAVLLALDRLLEMLVLMFV